MTNKTKLGVVKKSNSSETASVPPANRSDEIVLDECTANLLAEIEAESRRAANQAASAACAPYVAQMQGILQHVIRQNKAPGEYQLAPDGKRLVRVDGEPNISKRDPTAR